MRRPRVFRVGPIEMAHLYARGDIAGWDWLNRWCAEVDGTRRYFPTHDAAITYAVEVAWMEGLVTG
jgi:hypothetical protein